MHATLNRKVKTNKNYTCILLCLFITPLCVLLMKRCCLKKFHIYLKGKIFVLQVWVIVMNNLDKKLLNNRSEEAIKEELDKLCNSLPGQLGTVVSSCVLFF